MMTAFHWVTTALALLFLSGPSSASFFDCIYDNQYGDYYDVDSFPSIANGLIPNITIPCLPAIPPLVPPVLPPSDENCTTINPDGNISSGNAVFISLDGKTLAASLKVSAPCNKTGNAAAKGAAVGDDASALAVPASDSASAPAVAASDDASTPAKAVSDVANAPAVAASDDASAPTVAASDDPNAPAVTASDDPLSDAKVAAAAPGSGLVCNLLTLVKTLVDSILNLVLKLLKSLVDTIVNLLKTIIQTVLGKLLPTLINDLGSLLTKLLTDILNTVEKLVESLLGGLLAKDAIISGLLKEVETLLGGALSPVLGQTPLGQTQLNDVTVKVGALLNTTLLTVLEEVETLVKNLLSPAPAGLVPELTQNIAVLVNNTVQDLLDDVDKLVDDLLTGLLSDSSLVNNLTTDVTKLLNDVLGDTICNVEKLLQDSKSLSQLILNLEKLIQDLIDDILKDVDKLLVDELTAILTKQGILDKLLADILKLLQDLLTNLAFGNRLKSTAIGSDPELFMNNIMANLTEDMGNILNGVVPATPVDGLTDKAGLPSINPADGILPTGGLLPGVLPGVLGLVNTTLTDVVTAVRGLLNGLDTALVKDGNGLISNLLESIRALLDGLLKNLLGDVSILLGEKLVVGNLINPSSLTAPLGKLVTGILKQVLLCNGTCTPIPPTTPPPTTPGGNDPDPGDGNTTTPAPCVPTIPIFVPYPVSRGCLEDNLFNNVNDPSTFLQRLQIYQAYINRNVYRNIGDDYGGELVDSLLNCGNNPYALENFPYRLLNGIGGTARLTSNAASCGLLNLIGSLSNNSTS